MHSCLKIDMGVNEREKEELKMLVNIFIHPRTEKELLLKKNRRETKALRNYSNDRHVLHDIE